MTDQNPRTPREDRYRAGQGATDPDLAYVVERAATKARQARVAYDEAVAHAQRLVEEAAAPNIIRDAWARAAGRAVTMIEREKVARERAAILGTDPPAPVAQPCGACGHEEREHYRGGGSCCHGITGPDRCPCKRFIPDGAPSLVGFVCPLETCRATLEVDAADVAAGAFDAVCTGQPMKDHAPMRMTRVDAMRADVPPLRGALRPEDR